MNGFLLIAEWEIKIKVRGKGFVSAAQMKLEMVFLWHRGKTVERVQ